MTFQDIWHALTTIGRKAWGAVGATSAIVTFGFTFFYKDIQKSRSIPEWATEFGWPITFLVCIVFFSAIMLVSKLVSAWREKRGHVHVAARETVTYRAHPYAPGSALYGLSDFAHKAFKGDTMDRDIVQHAVKIGAATGLRLTDAQGANVGFLDAFHFTDTAMDDWMNGDLSEAEMEQSHFRKIPAKGKILNLAMGAIYLKPGVERGVAHHFANIGELFLRKSFPKFERINLYATIFAKDGERIAKLYKFDMSKEARHRNGPHANGHDLRLRIINLDEMAHLTGGVGGARHVVIEVAS
ncbi:MAG TPA: hypothetical protein VGM68_05480 [Rhizomicrobium sp.]|jgi:hypothetical protein